MNKKSKGQKQIYNDNYKLGNSEKIVLLKIAKTSKQNIFVIIFKTQKNIKKILRHS